MPKKAPYKRKSTAGSISFASNRGDKPWRAAITENGKKKHIGWFASEQEADEALIAYIDDPSQFPDNKTFKQVYDGWYKAYLEKEVKRLSRNAGYPVDAYDVEKTAHLQIIRRHLKGLKKFIK